MEKQNYSKLYRVIHWLIAISFILILFTIFLRLTWLNKYNVADIIKEYLGDTGQVLSEKQLIRLAKTIRQPMWNWHIYLGYFLTGLFVVRFSLPFFGKMKIQNPLEKGLTKKDKIKKWTYIIFYICVVISLVTGLIIEFGPREYKKPMEFIHVQSIYYLVAFIVIHLAGVLKAEFTSDNGIASRIVSGNKKQED
ncbi:cytochrome b/b6 domain-containing protein [Flavobacteriales bacterium]|nr:cytochrome b/b6 domain-containing protein [Flavobacteriales bacterium]